MTETNLNLLRGTLDLLILRALRDRERHGYAVAEWLEEVTDSALLVEEGTLYPALHRLEGRGLIRSRWGLSDNNRRAKYYALTARGKSQLARQTESWTRYARAVGKALEGRLG